MDKSVVQLTNIYIVGLGFLQLIESYSSLKYL